MQAWRLRTPRARRGFPFGVLRGYAGTDLAERRERPRSSSARSPASSWPRCRRTAPTSGIVHAQQADRSGNVQLWGIIGVQKETVLASARTLVTVEEVVDELEPLPGAVVLPSWVVDAVAPAPGGAHPVLRARLLRARQRLLRALGRDRPRPRPLHRLDDARASTGTRRVRQPGVTRSRVSGTPPTR